ncbi:MAG: hypothetical protein HFH68_01630 [Lachnospiraceae bacterium]|nr:hypothetical protein [Lachnospiraceae bacterium]
MNILSICKEKFMNEQIASGTLTGHFRRTCVPREVSSFSGAYIDALENTMRKFQLDYVKSGVFTDTWLDNTVRDLHVAFEKYKESLAKLHKLDSSVQFTVEELRETRKVWDDLLDAYTEIHIIDRTMAKQCLGSWNLELTKIKNGQSAIEDCQKFSLVAHAVGSASFLCNINKQEIIYASLFTNEINKLYQDCMLAVLYPVTEKNLVSMCTSDAYANHYTLGNDSNLKQYECSMEELQIANNSVITQHSHDSNFYYYGRFVAECLEKWNRRTADAPNEIILTSDENPVGLLCVEGYKHVEVVKAVAGLWDIPVIYYNRDKNSITRQFVEPVY